MIASLALTSLLLAAAPSSAPEPEVALVPVPVAAGITMLEGEGGNIGVLSGAEGVLVIDDQFPRMSEKLRAALAKLSPSPVRFLINTHWHGDHTGGNEALAHRGVAILAQENVRKRMSTTQVGFEGDTTPPSPAAAQPVVTYRDELRLHLNGEEVHVLHLPSAHTDGDSIVIFEKANVIQTGDILFTAGYPFIDLSTGGSLEGTIAAQERVLALANQQTKIIPGHGHLATKTQLREAHDMLVSVRDRVRALIAQKKTLEQAIDAKPTADFDARWGQWFVKPPLMVTLAYKSLTTR